MKSDWQHYLEACYQLDLAFPRWTNRVRQAHHWELSQLSNSDQNAYVERLIAAKNRKLTIQFICDRTACPPGTCRANRCHRTSDITHAIHFVKIGPSTYIEKGSDDDDLYPRPSSELANCMEGGNLPLNSVSFRAGDGVQIEPR